MPQVAREINFDNPVLKIEGLQVRFNTIPLSGCLARLLGSNDLALIVQQLHYWLQQGYGVVIDGYRWIHKSIKEMREEVWTTLSHWKLSQLIIQLVEREILIREKLFTKHQIQQGNRFWWQPKNQTYYYRINREKLQELANNYQIAETPETSVFCSTQKLSNQVDQNTKFSDCPKNITDTTSIENNSRKSHPTHPEEREAKQPLNQREELKTTQIETVIDKAESNQVNSAESEVMEKEISSAPKKEIVKENNLDKSVTKPKPKPKVDSTKPGGTKQKSLAPWKDQEEFKRFYHELIAALPIVANAHSPEGLAHIIIGKLKRGEPHTYWDDFKAGLPIGTSLQEEWEVQPGVAYPMFVEYLIEKIKKGNNSQTDEQARNEVFRILNQPRQAQDFWSQFKRSLINVSQEVDRYRALGVSNPHTPIWTRERIEPSIEEAATAGAKIMEVNNTTQKAISASTNPQLAAAGNTQLEGSSQSSKSDVITPDPWSDESPTESQTESSSESHTESSSDDDSPKMSLREMLTQKLGKRNLKGFVKQMPQVSQEEVKAEAAAEAAKEERANKNSKVKISRMTIAEINESLQDPILRKELTPQLWHSDYELITDELGQIIGVERSSSEE